MTRELLALAPLEREVLRVIAEHGDVAAVELAKDQESPANVGRAAMICSRLYVFGLLVRRTDLAPRGPKDRGRMHRRCYIYNVSDDGLAALGKKRTT